MAGKLTQQFVVDAAFKANNLNLIRNNQAKLRVDKYTGLQGYLRGSTDDNNDALPPGKVILPNSHKGSDRHYREQYYDAMTIISKFGKPDLFITFTCSPQWWEIKENLKPNEYYADRPDLVNRVFNMKLNNFMKRMTKDHVMGEVIAFMSVIEFQKRGLPHCDLLFILSKQFKFTVPEHVNRAVQAFLPNPEADLQLYDLVRTLMIHNPCNVASGCNFPCRKKNPDKCDVDYPKTIVEKTVMNRNGYPKYKRPKDGLTPIVQKGNAMMEINNQWVVPYNANFLLLYRTHINVQICTSIKCVKYINKYVHKGHDRARVVVNSDEIKSHIDTRYMTPNEGLHDILEFSLFRQSHSVEKLPVHLPFIFEHGKEAKTLQAAATRKTELLGSN